MKTMLAILMASLLAVQAQDTLLIPGYEDADASTGGGMAISVQTNFNSDDFQTGASLGYAIPENGFIFSTFFFFRPYKKKFLVPQSNNFAFQFRETRYIIGARMERRFFVNNSVGILLGGGAGYTFGTYAGSERTPEAKMIPVVNLGLLHRLGWKMFLEGGFMYADIPGLSGSRAYLGLTF